MNRQFRNAAVKSLDERRPREIRGNCTIETARVYFKRVDKHTRLGVWPHRLLFSLIHTRERFSFEALNIFQRACDRFRRSGFHETFLFRSTITHRLCLSTVLKNKLVLEGGVNNCKFQDFYGIVGFYVFMVFDICRYKDGMKPCTKYEKL